MEDSNCCFKPCILNCVSQKQFNIIKDKIKKANEFVEESKSIIIIKNNMIKYTVNRLGIISFIDTDVNIKDKLAIIDKIEKLFKVYIPNFKIVSDIKVSDILKVS